VFLPFTTLLNATSKEEFELIATYCHQAGGTQVVAYGSYDFPKDQRGLGEK
jgi:hypothetical protein